MGSSALFKFHPLSGPLLQSKPFPPRGILVNQPNSCRLHPRQHISSSTAPRRSFSHFCGLRHGGAVGSLGIGPMATAMAMGRRFMMGLVVVGCSAYNSASSYYSAGGASKEEEFVRKTISSHDVVIFSKSYCPYCQMAKDLFKELDKVPHVVELDEREDGIDIQDAIYDFVGRRTVPQVFIKGKHIGGSDDTIEAYESGSLTKLLS